MTRAKPTAGSSEVVSITMGPTPELTALVESCAEEVAGREGIGHYSEKGGSEDATVLMACVQERGGRAAHFYFGSNTPTPNHTSTFDPDDVKSMPVRFSVLVKALEKLNAA